MRNFLLLCVLLFLGCEALTVNPPPKVLLPQETMEDIIYDRLLLRTMESSRLVKEDSLKIFNEDYILRKYQVEDSTLQQNLEYYSQFPRRMTSMYVRIEARLDHLLDSLDQLAKKENEKLEKKED
ncbi:MAG: DUF4296 domain-containing protein [Flavobacteriaceae bacterium]